MVECPATSCTGPGAVCFQNQCCMPVAPSCMGRCGGAVVSNNCGLPAMCMGPCPAGQVCNGQNCCTPNGSCSGKCLDNCGQMDSHCCGNGNSGGNGS
jgi:hypothetical protein